MKIVTYNIQFGLGKDGNFDLPRIADEVAGADIITLQEVERYWQRSGNVDQVAQLSQLLNHYYWVYGPYFDVDASTPQIDGGINNVRRQFGNMILSKTPIRSSRLFPLPKLDMHNIHTMAVGVLEAVVDAPKYGAVRIYNTHLGARSQRERVAQIITMRDIIRRAPIEGGAWTGAHTNTLWQENVVAPPMPEDFVLLGDFNLQSSDPEYDHLVGPRGADLDRISTTEDYVDTWVVAGHKDNEGVTFAGDTSVREMRGMRIDYAFVPKLMQQRVLATWIDETAQGSDHQPYWLELDDAPRQD